MRYGDWEQRQMDIKSGEEMDRRTKPHLTDGMPLLERLEKGANCAVFLDGAPGPNADVADIMRKAAAEIRRLNGLLPKHAEPHPPDTAAETLE